MQCVIWFGNKKTVISECTWVSYKGQIGFLGFDWKMELATKNELAMCKNLNFLQNGTDYDGK